MKEIGKKIVDFAAKTAKNQLMSTEKDKENTDQSERSKHAETIIRNHVIWSMGAGLIPVLIADIFAVSALQLDMIRQLSRVYNVDFSEQQGKAIVTSLTSSTIARVSAGSLIKLIPGVGSLLGGLTVSIFAGASTYALGEVFKKHYETGGTILDFDPARLKKMYKEKFEKGKKMAEEWRKEEENRKKSQGGGIGDNLASNPDVLARLKELGELKSQGIITEEEFEQMKKRLIESF